MEVIIRSESTDEDRGGARRGRITGGRGSIFLATIGSKRRARSRGRAEQEREEQEVENECYREENGRGEKGGKRFYTAKGKKKYGNGRGELRVCIYER